jgi:hypothetical protein
MSADRSLGVRFAADNVDGEYCRRSAGVISSDTADAPSKDDMLKDRCGKSEHICCEMSGVDMISLEPETLRQWIKVSSVDRLERLKSS